MLSHNSHSVLMWKYQFNGTQLNGYRITFVVDSYKTWMKIIVNIFKEICNYSYAVTMVVCWHRILFLKWVTAKTSNVRNEKRRGNADFGVFGPDVRRPQDDGSRQRAVVSLTANRNVSSAFITKILEAHTSTLRTFFAKLLVRVMYVLYTVK